MPAKQKRDRGDQVHESRDQPHTKPFVEQVVHLLPPQMERQMGLSLLARLTTKCVDQI